MEVKIYVEHQGGTIRDHFRNPTRACLKPRPVARFARCLDAGGPCCRGGGWGALVARDTEFGALAAAGVGVEGLAAAGEESGVTVGSGSDVQPPTSNSAPTSSRNRRILVKLLPMILGLVDGVDGHYVQRVRDAVVFEVMVAHDTLQYLLVRVVPGLVHSNVAPGNSQDVACLVDQLFVYDVGAVAGVEPDVV